MSIENFDLSLSDPDIGSVIAGLPEDIEIKNDEDAIVKKREESRRHYEKNKTEKRFHCSLCNYIAPHLNALKVHRTRLRHKLKEELAEAKGVKEPKENKEVKEEQVANISPAKKKSKRKSIRCAAGSTDE